MSALYEIHPSLEGSALEQKVKELFPGNEDIQVAYARFNLNRMSFEEVMPLVDMDFEAYVIWIAKFRSMKVVIEAKGLVHAEIEKRLIEKYGKR